MEVDIKLASKEEKRIVKKEHNRALRIQNKVIIQNDKSIITGEVILDTFRTYSKNDEYNFIKLDEE